MCGKVPPINSEDGAIAISKYNSAYTRHVFLERGSGVQVFSNSSDLRSYEEGMGQQLHILPFRNLSSNTALAGSTTLLLPIEGIAIQIEIIFIEIVVL